MTRLEADTLSRRLVPLYAATFLQSLWLWVAIEKLFMTTIGFDPASVGLMAAVYAVVVPLLEVPSGVLADRWSRRGVLMLACLAAIASTVIGGLSQSVPMYMVSAAFLGVFIALQSGTLESMIYDTVLEETRDSDAFERTIGRVRVVESVALVGSALAGGAIAQIAPLPVTYFLTAPLLALSALVLFAFREPRLHKSDEPEPLRRQIATTYRTILAGGHLRLVVILTIVSSLLMQGTLEFGPLWLVALFVPPFLYGPHWAGLTGALGLGGMLGARAWFTQPWSVWILAGALVACGLVLVMSDHAVLVIGVQVLLTLIVVAVSIPATRSLHDAVPSTIRAGVASGVGTLTWLAFVPFALLVGTIAQGAGINQAGWVFVAVAVAAAVLMVVVLPRSRPMVAETLAVAPEPASDPALFPPNRFRPLDDPDWPGHWATPPTVWAPPGTPAESPEALAQAREAIARMPAAMRQVMVLRDMEGRAADEVSQMLNTTPEDVRVVLDQARGYVRAHLEQYFAGAGGSR